MCSVAANLSYSFPYTMLPWRYFWAFTFSLQCLMRKASQRPWLCSLHLLAGSINLRRGQILHCEVLRLKSRCTSRYVQKQCRGPQVRCLIVWQSAAKRQGRPKIPSEAEIKSGIHCSLLAKEVSLNWYWAYSITLPLIAFPPPYWEGLVSHKPFGSLMHKGRSINEIMKRG